MATGTTIITRALRLLGAAGSGATITTAEGTDGLEALNAMLDSWRTERLMVYAITQISWTATGATSYTIAASGGTVTAERPVRVEYAAWNDGTNDLPVEMLRLRCEYDAIPTKSDTGQPAYAYYNPTYPAGTLYLWPVPGSGTVKLGVWTAFSALSAVGDSVSLPPGYEDALVYNLAVRMAPEFGVMAPQLLMELARETKAAIKRANMEIPVLGIPANAPGMGGSRAYSIETDGA